MSPRVAAALRRALAEVVRSPLFVLVVVLSALLVFTAFQAAGAAVMGTDLHHYYPVYR